MVIGHAAGTEIHKMGSPLEGKRGSLIRVSAEWEMAPRVVHNSCPPPLRPAGGDGQCHGAGAEDSWSSATRLGQGLTKLGPPWEGKQGSLLDQSLGGMEHVTGG